MFKAIFSFLLLLIFQPVQAGIVEVGASASFRTSTVTKNDYSASESYTGSLAYYFTDSSALEGSYTYGFSKVVSGEAVTHVYTTLYGADFIFTMGPKDATFRPYLKAGAAQVNKQIRMRSDPDLEPVELKSCGVAPSGGAGFRLLVTETFSVKVGTEAWTSPINERCLPKSMQKTTYDTAYRAGISWLF